MNLYMSGWLFIHISTCLNSDTRCMCGQEQKRWEQNQALLLDDWAGFSGGSSMLRSNGTKDGYFFACRAVEHVAGGLTCKRKCQQLTPVAEQSVSKRGRGLQSAAGQASVAGWRLCGECKLLGLLATLFNPHMIRRACHVGPCLGKSRATNTHGWMAP